MLDLEPSRLTVLAGPVLALFEPEKRLFWPFLLAAVLITMALGWRRGEAGLGLGALLSRRLWWHPSARLDYRLIACKAVLRALVFPGQLLSTLVLAALVAAFLRRSLGITPSTGVSPWLAGTLYTLVAFLVDDWSRFAVHRAMHRSPLLWQIHKVHHSAEVMTPLTLYRTHPIESALNQVRGVLSLGVVTGVAIALVGPQLRGWEILGVDAIGFLWTLAGANLRHSHVWLSYGRWDRWLLSPSQHQVHHSKERRHFDSNFGEVLALWDRLGGSLYVADRREPLEFGLPEDEQPPHALVPLLLLPFVGVGRRLARLAPGAALATVALLLASGCTGKRFDRAALVSALGDCTLAVYKQAQTKATALSVAATAAAMTPSATTRSAAQTAWKDTMAVWEQAELLQYGPLSTADTPGGLGLRDSIYSWPNVDRCLIEQQLVSKLYESAAISTLAESTRSLAAIEYLLFYDGTDNACDATIAINAQGSWAALGSDELGKRKAAYAQALAGEVSLRIGALVTAWESGFLTELKTAGRGSKLFPSQQLAVDTVASALYHLDIDTKDRRLGNPLAFNNCTADTCPGAVESQWAGQSRPHLVANLNGFATLFNGCGAAVPPATGPVGFDDWLNAVGGASIASHMTSQIAAAKSALEALPSDDLRAPLSSNKQSVLLVYEAVKELSDALKQEFTATLAIKPPSRVDSDND